MVDPDEVARLCLSRYQQLPRRGKPEDGREWTLLAAVVRSCRDASSGSVQMEVVSLGTGTKCIGQADMSPNGDVLNDSHAEVIARRGCIRYLIQELRRAVTGQGSSVFCPADQRGQWKLRPGVSFIFFTCHTPCGDASIIPMSDGQCQPCPPVTPAEDGGQTDGARELKRKAEEPGEGQPWKLLRVEEEDKGDAKQCGPPTLKNHVMKAAVGTGPHTAAQPENPSSSSRTDGAPPVPDIHRTGAKCVPGGPADPLAPGVGFHSTGVLRVKPGRGEPTLSLSCSDKLARWGVLGFQGALLSLYLEEALYFSTVVVGKCPYSEEAMHRALVERCSHVCSLPAGFSVHPPTLLQSSLEFPFNQTQVKLRHQATPRRLSPCGAAISWCNVKEQPLDVTANGYKHGCTKKRLGTPKSRSLLCKLELFHSFLSVVSSTDPSALPDTLRGSELHTYWDYKQTAQSYQQAWRQLHSQAFPLWPRSDRKLLLFH
ncbi:tRNA-specific adenosine deaminase 1 isoform 2-T2 [Pholidichthys leucotaenia]